MVSHNIGLENILFICSYFTGAACVDQFASIKRSLFCSSIAAAESSRGTIQELSLTSLLCGYDCV